jgi:hypothetical protein
MHKGNRMKIFAVFLAGFASTMALASTDLKETPSLFDRSVNYEAYVSDVDPYQLTTGACHGSWSYEYFYVVNAKAVGAYVPAHVPNYSRLTLAILYARHNSQRLDVLKQIGSSRVYSLSISSAKGPVPFQGKSIVLNSVNPDDIQWDVGGFKLHGVVWGFLDRTEIDSLRANIELAKREKTTLKFTFDTNTLKLTVNREHKKNS